MIKDRLGELHQKITTDHGYNDDNWKTRFSGSMAISGSDEIAIQMSSADEDDYFKPFFVKVDSLKALIEDLKQNVDSIRALHNDILSNPISPERMISEMDDLSQTIKSSSRVIRSKLKEIEKIEETYNDEDSGYATVKIISAQRSMLVRQFIAVVNQYQLAQADYRDRCEVRIRRQVGIAGLNISEGEVDNMMEQGNFHFFTQEIMTDNEQSRHLFEDVQARHKDIIKCEKSITELHDLFLEMALLIESQGDLVDRIEDNVEKTREDVKETNVELHIAQSYRDKARKKKAVILAICLLVLLAVLMNILSYFF